MGTTVAFVSRSAVSSACGVCQAEQERRRRDRSLEIEHHFVCRNDRAFEQVLGAFDTHRIVAGF